MSEAEAARWAWAARRDRRREFTDDETMIINMGPQHPSTHGVLRLMIELDGETVLRTKPVIGYLHTGMEKTAEDLMFMQGGTNVTRMDYLSPLHNECVSRWQPKSFWASRFPSVRSGFVCSCYELNRLLSHLLFMATNGMDVGAISMMLYGWRDAKVSSPSSRRQLVFA